MATARTSSTLLIRGSELDPLDDIVGQSVQGEREGAVAVVGGAQEDSPVVS